MAPWAGRPFETYVAELHADVARTRRQAAAALQVTGDPRAVGPLLAALEDADAGVRAVVARALGALRDRRAVPPLLTALRNADAEVRRAAAEALWRLGDPAAIPGLAAAVDDREPAVRYFAACGLVLRYTPGGTHPPLLGPGEHPQLHERAWRAMLVPPPGSAQSGDRRGR